MVLSNKSVYLPSMADPGLLEWRTQLPALILNRFVQIPVLSAEPARLAARRPGPPAKDGAVTRGVLMLVLPINSDCFPRRSRTDQLKKDKKRRNSQERGCYPHDGSQLHCLRGELTAQTCSLFIKVLSRATC